MPLPSFTPITDDVTFPKALQLNEAYDAIEKIAPGVPVGDHVNIESITANKTLVDDDYPVQSLNLDAARNITLPANATTNHPFYFWNRSAFILTVKDASASTIMVIPATSGGFVFPDSQGWIKVGGAIDVSSVLSDETVTVGTNISDASAATMRVTQYGDIVFFFGSVTLNPINNDTLSEVLITIPIASNFGTGSAAHGSCIRTTDATETGLVRADQTTNKLKLRFISSTTASHSVSFSGLYRVN